MLFSTCRVCTILIILFYLVSVPVFAEQSPVIETTVAEPVLIDLADMRLVGEMTTIGVRATSYIVVIDSGENSDVTHKIVVTFVNEKSGVPLAKALVGIKHRKLFGDASDPVWMHSSPDQPELFVADLSLQQRGTYLFIVGSKLEDDKKRQFTFEYLY